MTSFLSRVLVVAIGAPVVLGAIYLGGWWLFALVVLGTLVGLHEFYAMARPLRPLVLAGYGGGIAALLLSIILGASMRRSPKSRSTKARSVCIASSAPLTAAMS